MFETYQEKQNLSPKERMALCKSCKEYDSLFRRCENADAFEGQSSNGWGGVPTRKMVMNEGNFLLVFGSLVLVVAIGLAVRPRDSFAVVEKPDSRLHPWRKWVVLDVAGMPTPRPRFNGKFAYMPKTYVSIKALVVLLHSMGIRNQTTAAFT